MKIFFSYRRSDSLDFSGRLYDRLVAHFDRGSIFKDIDAISLGTDFQSVIQQEVMSCDVFLSIIGKTWLAKDESGRRRLDDHLDFVRIETETALRRGIPVVPILVHPTSMPCADELPTELQELAFRNALAIRPDPDFSRDTERLIHALENLLARIPNEPSGAEAAAPEVDVSQIETGRVFVSHSTSDRSWVEKEVIAFLEREGILTWYSTSAISTASQWEREILRGLESCDWFMLVVSPRAAKSEWVKDELFWAIDHRPTRIVPVIMERCDLYKFHIRLPRIQHADFTVDAKAAKQRIIETLRAPEFAR
jgi:hypothetical protein